MQFGEKLTARTFKVVFAIVWVLRLGFILRDGLFSIPPFWLGMLWFAVTGAAAFHPSLLGLGPKAETATGGHPQPDSPSAS